MNKFNIIIFLLLGTAALFAQNLTDKQIEADLRSAYAKLESVRYSGTTQWDSIAAMNENFKEKLLKYTSAYPSTLTYGFDSLLQAGLMMVTSDDKLFRIYSWGTGLGGTMQYFENVFQYKAGGQVYSLTPIDTSLDEEEDYVPFYSRIFTLNAKGRTYYLGVYNGIYSTNDASQSIKIFTIENNSLNDRVELIKTKSGLVNSIDVSFNFFSVVDRPERPLRLIKYDDKNKIIYIPVVYKDGTVTNRFILYKFNGRYFELLKTQKKK